MQSKSNRKFLGGIACLAMAAAVGVGATAPEQASAMPKVKQAKFKLTVEGWQKNDWSINHESTSRCDPSDHSYGGEYAKFKSIKPVTLTAIQIGKEQPSFMIGKGLPYVDTTADVARNSTPAVSGVPADCIGSGGGDGPNVPDCGLKTLSPYPVALEYSPLFKKSITLTSAGVFGPLYQYCGGGVFPNLLASDTTGFPIHSELPPKELFDKKIGKLIVIGHGEYDFPMAEVKDRTEVHWEVTLTRKGKKRK
jgi:hypothetical protein